MAEQILVPLGKHDRIGDVLPYLEKIARPGMRVVFLIRYPANDFYPLLAYLESMETAFQTRLAAGKIALRYGWDEQRRIAEQRVFPACKALREKGVETAVDLHAGSVRRVVKSYTSTGDVQLIVAPARMGLSALMFFQWTTPRFSVFAPSGFSLMLLQRPNHTS